MGGEIHTERGDERAVLVVERASSAEVMVVLRDAQESLARDAAAAGHVLEEGHHVLGTLRTTERDENERVVHGHAPSYPVDLSGATPTRALRHGSVTRSSAFNSASLRATPRAFALRAACAPVLAPASGTIPGLASSHARAIAATSTSWRADISRRAAITGDAAATFPGANAAVSERGGAGRRSPSYVPHKSPCSSGL